VMESLLTKIHRRFWGGNPTGPRLRPKQKKKSIGRKEKNPAKGKPEIHKDEEREEVPHPPSQEKAIELQKTWEKNKRF